MKKQPAGRSGRGRSGWQAWVLTLLLGSAAVGHPSLDPEGIPDGQWPLYRHDSRLTGYVRGRGKILKPKIAWTLPLGLRPTALVAVTEPMRTVRVDFNRDGHPDTYSISGRTLTVTSGGPDKGTYTFTIPDEQTDGFHSACVKVGNFLPGVRGQEIVAWTSHMSTGVGRGRLFAFDEGIGKGRVAWTTEPMEKTCYSPELVAADIDNDGVLDIALAPHYQVFVFDAVTGKVKANVRWPAGRNYGLFAAANADDDPELELFVLNDFTLHLSMIDFEPGGGRLGWFKNYKAELEAAGRRPLSFRFRPDTVSDVHGDGYADLVINRLDDRRDGRWHVVVMSTDTGQVLADLADHMMAAVIDLDGDQVKEVICQGTQTQYPRPFCPVRVYNLDTQRPDFRGEIPRAKLLWRAARFGPTVSSIANDGHRTVLITRSRRGAPPQIWMLLDEDQDNRPEAVATYEFKNDRLVESWSFERENSYLDVRSVDTSKRGRVIVDVVDLLTGKRWTGQHGQRLKEADALGESEPGPGAIPLVVDLDGDKRNEIIVEDALQTIRVLAVPRKAKEKSEVKPQLVWEHPGHGMNRTPGYTGALLSVQAADLDRDGRQEVLLAATNRLDEPELRVLRHDGSLLWTYTVRGVTAAGIDADMDIWFVGQFVGDATLDVYCSCHTLEKGSSRAVMLDGRTGRPAWEHDTITVAKTKERFAFGVYGGSVMDVNNDKYDDLILTHYTALGIHDGQTGKPLWPIRKWADDYFDGWVAYSWPTALRLFENDEPIIYANTSSYAAGTVGAITLSGERLMNHPLTYETGPSGFQAVGDGDDDGYVEVGYGHRDGRFVCYDLNTGKKRWEERIPAGGTSDVILADVDGDDAAEFVFCDNAGRLVALNIEDEPAEGRVQWSFSLGAGKSGVAGQPIAGDVDGDGELEILLVSSFTGQLVCIDHDPTYKPPASKPASRPSTAPSSEPASRPATQPAAKSGKTSEGGDGVSAAENDQAG